MSQVEKRTGNLRIPIEKRKLRIRNERSIVLIEPMQRLQVTPTCVQDAVHLIGRDQAHGRLFRLLCRHEWCHGVEER